MLLAYRARLLGAVGRSDHETLVWVRALYARTTEPYRSRMLMILGFLATQCDVTDMDKTLYIVERYAPMLLRDGSSAYMSLHHMEGFPAATECLLLFLTYLDRLDGGLAPTALHHHLDGLLHETVHASLFATLPPRTRLTGNQTALMFPDVVLCSRHGSDSDSSGDARVAVSPLDRASTAVHVRTTRSNEQLSATLSWYDQARSALERVGACGREAATQGAPPRL